MFLKYEVTAAQQHDWTQPVALETLFEVILMTQYMSINKFGNESFPSICTLKGNFHDISIIL